MRNVIDMDDKDAVYAVLDEAPRVPLTQNDLGDATIAENADESRDSFGDDGDKTER